MALKERLIQRKSMYESQIARLRQIAELLRQTQELYQADPPPAPVGILLGADITSAAARTQQLINQLTFRERTSKRVAFPFLRTAPG